MPPKRKAAKKAERNFEATQGPTQPISSADELSEPGPPAKRTRARHANANATTKARKSNDVAKEVEDAPPSSAPGLETQQFVQAIEALKKKAVSKRKDGWVEKFAGELSRKKEEFEKQTGDWERERVESHTKFAQAFNAQVVGTLRTADPNASTSSNKLGRSTKKSGTKGSSDTTESTPNPNAIENHPLYRASNILLNISVNTIAAFKSACKLVEDAKPDKALGENWQGEHNQLISILDMGERVARRQVNRVSKDAAREKQTTCEKEDAMTIERENAQARNVLGMAIQSTTVGVSGKEGEEAGWMKRLEWTEKGLKRMSRALPAPSVMD